MAPCRWRARARSPRRSGPGPKAGPSRPQHPARPAARNPGVVRDHVAVLGRVGEPRGGRDPERRLVEEAEVAEEVVRTPRSAMATRSGRGRAAAAEFGGDEHLAHRPRRRCRTCRRRRSRASHRAGAPKAATAAKAARFLRLVRQAWAAAKGRKSSVLPPEWKSSTMSAQRQQVARGNSRRSSPSPCRPAGPGSERFILPLSIGEVRVPAAKGRIVHAGHDDDPARDVLGLERAGEVEQRDRPLVLVAMVAAGEQRRRPLAAAG